MNEPYSLEINIDQTNICKLLKKGIDPVEHYKDVIAREVNLLISGIPNNQLKLF